MEAGAGAVFVGALPQTGTSTQEEQGEEDTAEEESVWDYETDVVVAGGALGGCTAGLAAALQGADVIVVEAGPETGGTALGSTGFVHMSGGQEDLETLREVAPDVDEELGAAMIESYHETIDLWVDQGFPIADDPEPAGFYIGESYQEIREFFDHYNQRLEDEGVTIMTDTTAESIVVDENRVPIGLLVKGDTDELSAIGASKVILAMGGYQGNPGLKNQFLGRGADATVHRSVPFNKGDGLKMAQAVGGRMSEGGGGHYGHLVPYPPIVPQHDPEGHYEMVRQSIEGDSEIEYRNTLLQDTSIASVLINTQGERFVDESQFDQFTAMEVSAQPLGRGYMIFDDTVAEMDTRHGTARDSFEMTQELAEDGTVAQVDSLSELADQFDNLAPAVEAKIEDFNEAMEADDQTLLDAPREDNREPIDEPPFYAVRCTAGISHTYGGVAINGNAEVLDHNDRTVSNLYAVPATAGGVAQRYYIGGLSQNMAFGKIAGEAAAGDL